MAPISISSISSTCAGTNATTSPTMRENMVGWVSPSPQRSTWEILWSCLSVFVLCSWRAIHLNLPTPEESEEKWNEFHVPCLLGKKKKNFSTVPYWPQEALRRKWGRKMLWMVAICIAPEIGVGIAAMQYVKACRARDDANNAACRGHGHGHDDKFTLAHAFYANMGGIVVRRISLQDVQAIEAAHRVLVQSSQSEERPATTARHANEWSRKASSLVGSVEMKEVKWADTVTRLGMYLPT